MKIQKRLLEYINLQKCNFMVKRQINLPTFILLNESYHEIMGFGISGKISLALMP